MTHGACDAQKERSRRIAILTYGTRGDVEPFVALGVGLSAAGHTVRLAAPAPFAALARGRGLEFAPLAGDPSGLAASLADRAGLRWSGMVAAMVRHVLPIARSVYRGASAAVRNADLVVHSLLMTDTGHTLARALGVPDVSAQFFPMFLPTRAFAAVAAPHLELGGVYRRLTHHVSTAIFRYGSRLLYSRLRSAAPELPPLAPWPFAGPRTGRTPILFAYDRALLPRPADWPSYAHVTGYWRMPPEPSWSPPRELSRFQESGSPPIYFGLGSVRGESMEGLIRMVIEAIHDSGQRLLLGTPSRRWSGRLEPSSMMSIESVPHAWLFPRMGYILHHGGAGTTGAAAAAGVPNSALPFSADQAFWARQITRQGLGPKGAAARQITPDRLQSMIHEAMANPTYRLRAADIAAQIRQTDGISRAIEVIEDRLPINPAEVS